MQGFLKLLNHKFYLFYLFMSTDYLIGPVHIEHILGMLNS